MSLAARARYLIAMGLVPVFTADLACDRTTAAPTPDSVTANAKATPEPATPVTPEPTPVPTPIPTPELTPDPPPVQQPLPPQPTIQRVELGEGAWQVVYVPPERDRSMAPPEYPRATCPSGQFCEPAPNTVQTPAQDPHTKCEASVKNRMGDTPTADFSAHLTAQEQTHRSDACCYTWSIPCPGGRPLRDDDGTPVLASAHPRPDWVGSPTSQHATTPDPATSTRLASHWLAEAAAEHASVASLARFSLQLLALGAPPDLLAGAHQAAQDEVRHAQACYALAARYTGVHHGPGPLTLPTPAIASDPAVVAYETLRDGCIGESVAAYCVAQAAAAARDPAVAQVLKSIAADEETHAALAWRTLAWLLDHHEAKVRPVLEQVLASVQATPEPPLPHSPTNRDAAFGVLGPDHQHANHHAALHTIVQPCLQALLTTSRSDLDSRHAESPRLASS